MFNVFEIIIITWIILLNSKSTITENVWWFLTHSASQTLKKNCCFLSFNTYKDFFIRDCLNMAKFHSVYVKLVFTQVKRTNWTKLWIINANLNEILKLFLHVWIEKSYKSKLVISKEIRVLQIKRLLMFFRRHCS